MSLNVLDAKTLIFSNNPTVNQVLTCLDASGRVGWAPGGGGGGGATSSGTYIQNDAAADKTGNVEWVEQTASSIVTGFTNNDTSFTLTANAGLVFISARVTIESSTGTDTFQIDVLDANSVTIAASGTIAFNATTPATIYVNLQVLSVTSLTAITPSLSINNSFVKPGGLVQYWSFENAMAFEESDINNPFYSTSSYTPTQTAISLYTNSQTYAFHVQPIAAGGLDVFTMPGGTINLTGGIAFWMRINGTSATSIFNLEIFETDTLADYHILFQTVAGGTGINYNSNTALGMYTATPTGATLNANNFFAIGVDETPNLIFYVNSATPIATLGMAAPSLAFAHIRIRESSGSVDSTYNIYLDGFEEWSTGANLVTTAYNSGDGRDTSSGTRAWTSAELRITQL